MKKVFLGLSGGVDSAVSAYLLKKQNYDVTCVFMKNWEEDDSTDFCSAQKDFEDAQQVAKSLNLKFTAVNFASEYWDNVFVDFINELDKGLTPNPDIFCNSEIKFKVFMQFALANNADYIATGHYARNIENKLYTGLDDKKDQTYFLYRLTQEQLKKTIFPIGDMQKNDIRKIAKELKLPNAEKKDSTGICFIGSRKFSDFIRKYTKNNKQGDIISDCGHTLGKHNGLAGYTIGQRQGLGIGGNNNFHGSAWYVIKKNIEENKLIVSQNNNKLFKNNLYCHNIHWIAPNIKNKFQCSAKIRYQQKSQECIVELLENNTLFVQFVTPQRAITPGQSIVFYQEDLCLGGGIISNR